MEKYRLGLGDRKNLQKSGLYKRYRGFRIDGPASSWPKGHEKTKSSWPSKNGFGHNSAGLSPILMRICMVKDTFINKIFRIIRFTKYLLDLFWICFPDFFVLFGYS